MLWVLCSCCCGWFLSLLFGFIVVFGFCLFGIGGCLIAVVLFCLCWLIRVFEVNLDSWLILVWCLCDVFLLFFMF